MKAVADNNSFSKPYLTGYPEIDEEHEDLFTVVEEFNVAVRSRAEPDLIEKMISVACNYADYHFTHEETIMRNMGYPFHNEHKKCHELFLSTIQRLQQEFASGQEISAEISYFLKSWIRDHVFGIDKELAAFLRGPV